ncbi:MAG TPA: hypothetical protein VMU89_13995 [Thermomicrobiaceae bacterium]|nr:hypothetical protein [Thermomicrobiaceae bacterium]
MTEPRAAIVAGIDIDTSLDEEIREWYLTEHAPERLAVPGIESFAQWWRVDGDAPRYVSLFEARGRDVLESGPYVELKERGDTPWSARIKRKAERILRGVYEEAAVYRAGTRAPFAAIAYTDLAPEDEGPYREWYDRGHGPALVAVPGVVGMRRFEQAASPRHLTVILVEDPAVLESPEYRAARDSAPDPGLRGRWRRLRGVYRFGAALP